MRKGKKRDKGKFSVICMHIRERDFTFCTYENKSKVLYCAPPEMSQKNAENIFLSVNSYRDWINFRYDKNLLLFMSFAIMMAIYVLFGIRRDSSAQRSCEGKIVGSEEFSFFKSEFSFDLLLLVGTEGKLL